MNEERFEKVASGNISYEGAYPVNRCAGVTVYGNATVAGIDQWRDRLLSLLRAGLAAEEAPEGLWPGPVVGGRQTYYGEGRDVPGGWTARYHGDKWVPEISVLNATVVQCRPPAPQPVTVDVPPWDAWRRVLAAVPVERNGPVCLLQHDLDGWWYSPDEDGGEEHTYRLPLNVDGSVTVLIEGGAS